jgi:DNA-binding CsgD family transcriptional regulator
VGASRSPSTDALLDVVDDLGRSDSREEFGRGLAEGIAAAVGADLVSYQENDHETRRHIEIFDRSVPPWTRAQEETYWAYHAENLLDRHYARTGDLRPHRLSDFMSRRDYRRTRLYNEFFRDAGVEYQLQFPLVSGVEVGVGLQRAARDFSARDVSLLASISAPLRHAYAAVVAREQVTALTGALEAGADAVAAVRLGRIANATARAAALVADDADLVVAWADRGGSGCLRLATAHVVALSRHRDGTANVVAFFERTREVDQQALRALGLSRREAEVLAHVAEGKTNPEIAAALFISRRTVKKHLEQIFEKLGVRTRTAAAALAHRAPNGD